MKIWFDFSSNHSGTYVVLGKFNTVEAAKDAKEKLNKAIKEWMSADGEDQVTITGPDGLLWNVESIDWEDEPEAQQNKKVVSIYLDTSGYGTNDLEKMIKKMGGKAKTRSEEDLAEW